ncbi:hypothetical protein [Tsukamurella soli]|uniref:hypothetical protein n=1 Tax=Tsukamurella soli TaxID=644556 RepID=UPI003616076A
MRAERAAEEARTIPAALAPPADAVAAACAALAGEAEAYAAGYSDAEARQAATAAAAAAVPPGPPFSRRAWDRWIGGRETSVGIAALSLVYPHRVESLVCACPVWAVDGTPGIQLHSTGCRWSGTAHAFEAGVASRLGVAPGSLLTPVALAAAVRGIAEADVEAAIAAEEAAPRMTATQGATSGAEGGEAAAPAARPASWSAEAAPIEARLFTMTPGLRTVSAAAAALGVGRQGLLAVTLTRTAVAVGPHVRLLTAGGRRGTARQGGSLNLFTGLVGKPNAGKTESMDAGAYLVPLPDDVLIPEGTGEGIVKSFGFMRREKTGQGDEVSYDYVFTEMAKAVLMVADEVDAVFAEMVRQGTKFAPMWRSMWMGAMVGTTTGNVELRTRLLPHSYRLGALLGCQPDATIPLWAEGNRGTPQRILWAPVTRRKPDGAEPPAPLALAYQAAPNATMLPDAVVIGTVGEEQPRWIEWPPAARAFIEAELEAVEVDDDPYGESQDDEDDPVARLLGHATFLRLKVMALLAIMDGLEQPSDIHWEAAGLVMQLREQCMRRTMARATRAGQVAAEGRGLEQGRTRSAAKRGEVAADAEFAVDLDARIITVVGRLLQQGKRPSYAAIRRLCSERQKAHLQMRLGALVHGEVLTVDVDGVYSMA